MVRKKEIGETHENRRDPKREKRQSENPEVFHDVVEVSETKNIR